MWALPVSCQPLSGDTAVTTATPARRIPINHNCLIVLTPGAVPAQPARDWQPVVKSPLPALRRGFTTGCGGS